METEKKNKTKGIIGTLLFHALLLLLFLFFGFTTPLPLPAEQGIAINFGDAPDGDGDVQPEQSGDMKDNEAAPAAAAAPSTSSSKDVQAVTQDVDDAPSINTTPKPKDSKVVNKNETKPVETPMEEPKPVINPKALYQPGAGSGAAGGSQGQTGKPGDQGNPDGSRDTQRQGDGSTGGLTGSPNFTLAGRQLTQVPTLSDKSQLEGRVVVKIWVDKSGGVLRSEAGEKGTTISDLTIRKKCEDAALRAIFTPSETAREEQTGTITFIFGFK